MKTLHVTYSFFPDAVGGTEVYVETLARDLKRLGIDAVIAAPGPVESRYSFSGLWVRRFATDQRHLAIRDLYGRGESAAADAFDRILDEERPDLVHQHALTAACSIQLVERAQRRGVPVVFTYHTPTVSCQRGALLEWGTDTCDGKLGVSRCTACSLHGRGLATGLSRVLANSPSFVGEFTEKAGFSGGPWTAVRMRTLTALRLEVLAELFDRVDRFIALVPWVRALLVANGVSERKIVDCRHGVPNPQPRVGQRQSGCHDRLRVAHLGRLDPIKGTRLLLQALVAIPDAPIDLDVYGVVQSREDSAALADLRALAASDERIRFQVPIGHAAVVERLSAYDLVAVPSQTLETGPLVVLEAFAAGVPVVGSALGGIADQIVDGIDGVLVRPHDSIHAWSVTLARLCDDRAMMRRLSQGIEPVRSSSEVAREMVTVYETLWKPALIPSVLC